MILNQVFDSEPSDQSMLGYSLKNQDEMSSWENNLIIISWKSVPSIFNDLLDFFYEINVTSNGILDNSITREYIQCWQLLNLKYYCQLSSCRDSFYVRSEVHNKIH